MAVVIILKNYYFRIIIWNLTKWIIFSTFALNNNGKFTQHKLENLCPRSLASTISVLGHKRVCRRYTFRRKEASIMKHLIWLQYAVRLNKLHQHVRSNEFNRAVKCWISKWAKEFSKVVNIKILSFKKASYVCFSNYCQDKMISDWTFKHCLSNQNILYRN